MVKTDAEEQESPHTPTPNQPNPVWWKQCNRALPIFGKGGIKCHGQLSFISININRAPRKSQAL